MSKLFLVLSGLMTGVVALHVFGGGPQYAEVFHSVLQNDDVRVMAWVLWHAVTFALSLLALGYLWLAFRPSLALVAFSTALQLGWAVLFLTGGLLWLESLWIQPQWVLFLAFPMLAVLAHLRHPGRASPDPAC